MKLKLHSLHFTTSIAHSLVNRYRHNFLFRPNNHFSGNTTDFEMLLVDAAYNSVDHFVALGFFEPST